MAGVDAKDGEIAIQGWQETAGDYIRWAETFELLGAGCLLYTNVDVEGLQQGVAIGPVQEIISRVHVPVVVARWRIRTCGYCCTPGGRGVWRSARLGAVQRKD